MKKLLIFLFFIPLFIPNLAHAQIKEINPSIQWRFVKSQELTLKDGNWYSYEFVADKGFDYIFTLTHYSDLAKASIQVFNLQDDKIAEFKADSSKITAALEFDVKQSVFRGKYHGHSRPNRSANFIHLNKTRKSLNLRKQFF
jgi:hypothetical protein